MDKINKNNLVSKYITETGEKMYYHNAPVSWHKIFNFVPFYSENGNVKQSSHLKNVSFLNKKMLSSALCLFSSSLFYWFNWNYSNCRDLSLKDISGMRFSFDILLDKESKELDSLSSSLMKDLKQNSKIYKRISNDNKTEFDSFYPMYSKAIVNEIDKVFAKHYGFSEEELDFIINYDIKYRMGSELEGK